MNYGYIRVAAAIPELKVADCSYNIEKIKELALNAERENVQTVCFPELSVTGYTCADLFFQRRLLQDANNALQQLLVDTKNCSTVIILGMPVDVNNQLFNCAVVIQKGRILGIAPKTFLPNNNEFYEKRWFTSGVHAVSHNEINFLGQLVPFGTDILFRSETFSFAIEICEDLWVTIPPSSHHALQGAEIIFNLSASNELIGKHEYLKQLIEQQSARCHAGYVYASSGWGESTTDVVFAGNGIIAENGKIIANANRFSFDEQLVISEIDVERLQAERVRNTNFSSPLGVAPYRNVLFNSAIQPVSTLSRKIEQHPFVPSLHNRDSNCEEIFSIQVGGLAKRWKHTGAKNLVIGISGGLDSTLALLVCVKTADKLGWDRKQIIGITMPGFGTTSRTYNNAISLMESLGITTKEISIKEASLQHFKDIEHNPEQHDVTYENTQARERTQILMNIANKFNGLVIGTGDLSELALGWATYNGDHMSMYGVNSGIPKTLVRYLVDWAAHQLDEKSECILKDILNTPVSPELLPTNENDEITQKTEDLVGPYELHDFFLYYLIRFGFTPEKIFFLAQQAFKEKYSDDTIKKWLKTFIRRFYSQQFKRSCLPDGPKVGSINLSPRGDWRMPSDAIGPVFE